MCSARVGIEGGCERSDVSRKQAHAVDRLLEGTVAVSCTVARFVLTLGPVCVERLFSSSASATIRDRRTTETFYIRYESIQRRLIPKRPRSESS
jgi:hypothetical protein